jgi:hypothetical protein
MNFGAFLRKQLKVRSRLEAHRRRLKYFAWLSLGAAVKYRLLRLLHWRMAVSLDIEIVVAEMEFLQQPPPAIVL